MPATRPNPADWVRLVWKVANRERRHGESKAALFSSGAVGLLRAARLWDPDRANTASFITYAWKAITRAIRHDRDRERSVRRIRPAKAGGGCRHLVLFSEFGSDYVRGKAPEFATVPPAEPDESADLYADLESLFRDKPRYLRVLELRFGLRGHRPLTLNECGERFGITCECIRQIEVRAVRRLRRVMNPNIPNQSAAATRLRQHLGGVPSPKGGGADNVLT